RRRGTRARPPRRGADDGGSGGPPPDHGDRRVTAAERARRRWEHGEPAVDLWVRTQLPRLRTLSTRSPRALGPQRSDLRGGCAKKVARLSAMRQMNAISALLMRVAIMRRRGARRSGVRYIPAAPD